MLLHLLRAWTGKRSTVKALFIAKSRLGRQVGDRLTGKNRFPRIRSFDFHDDRFLQKGLSMRRVIWLLTPLLGSLLCVQAIAKNKKDVTPVTAPVGEWLDLFDGKTLQGWEVLKKDHFDLAGKVFAENGAIVMEAGAPYTGITWTGDFPRDCFEVEWKGIRRNNYDIFCGLTVPVGEEYVTYVLGGWGGSVVGLSNVDFMNANDNQTTCIEEFENGTWYTFRIRVEPEKIQAWIDDKLRFEQPREDHKFDIYYQLEPNRPLGFFTWNTEGGIKDIRMRRIKANP